MLFHVSMTVKIPHDANRSHVDALKAQEKARCQELMKAGVWRHIWRVVGEYANVSIFDVENGATLHDILMSLPLFPYMDVKVTPLCRHPSSIHEDDR